MTAREIAVVTCSVVCVLSLGSCGSEAATSKSTTIDVHTSRDSLDWEGTYRGTLPCADCEGIETSVTLKYDGTYRRQSTYLGKTTEALTDEGKFVWDALGQMITLTSQNGSTQMYKVGENLLIHLDRRGRRITGDLADRYLLVKDRAESSPDADDG